MDLQVARKNRKMENLTFYKNLNNLFFKKGIFQFIKIYLAKSRIC